MATAAAARPGRGLGPTLLLCVAEVLGMSGFMIFAALLPPLQALWGLDNTAAGWISGIPYAGYVLAVPVLVSLTDRVDARAVYIVSAGVAAAASLGFALAAGGFWTALLFRFLTGVGLAGTYMPGLKALTDRIAAEHQARLVAFYTASFSIGSSLSFLLAGVAAGLLGWRWAFGLAAVGPVLALLLGPPARTAAPPGTALLDFRPVLRSRPTMAYVLAYVGHCWELFAMRSWIVAFLAFSLSLQPGGGGGWDAPALVAAVLLLGLPASIRGNELAIRFGRARMILGFMALSVLLSLALGFAAPQPFLLVAGLASLYVLAINLDSAAITAGAVAAAPAGYRGTAMAVHAALGFSGAVVAPLAVGMVLDAAGGGRSVVAWGLAFLTMGLGSVTGGIALRRLSRPWPGPAQAQPQRREPQQRESG